MSFSEAVDTTMALDPSALLTRDKAAEALTEVGYPTSPATLATLACRPGKRGGPPYRMFGPRVLYRWSDLLEWAESKTSAPRRSTSEPIRYGVRS